MKTIYAVVHEGRARHNAGQQIPCAFYATRSLADATDPDLWRPRLKPLAEVDWSRSNPDWEGRAIIGGRVSKNHSNVVLTVNYLRQKLGMELGPEEASIEATYLQGER